MGKKRFPKLESGSSRTHTPISLREEATGKYNQTKSDLRVEHLKKLSVWATTHPLIPSLGPFYAQRLATLAEAAGVPPHPSLITCPRCETVLHPGFSSTVRIEKNKSKVRHKHKKSGNITQNSVVYRCHFCSHQHLKRGTPKGHIKTICPSKDKSSLESTPTTKPIMHACKRSEGKKRRRNSSTSKEAIETPSVSARVEVAKTQSTASKRRRKSWTSLKEIAQSNEHYNS